MLILAVVDCMVGSLHIVVTTEVLLGLHPASLLFVRQLHTTCS